MSGRILAIGDIHGCARLLERLLAFVEIALDDTLVTLGDYVDRGPDSCGVLTQMLELKRHCQLVPLLGNHDMMMLHARSSVQGAREWLLPEVGGQGTLHSYHAPLTPEGLSQVPEAHWHFLEQECRKFWETDTHFFVHANALPDVPLAEQPDYVRLWERFETAKPHQSGKVMVCGHTSQKSGLPANRGYALCLDTYAYGGGWLSCLDVGSGWVWQVAAGTKVREFDIRERLLPSVSAT